MAPLEFARNRLTVLACAALVLVASPAVRADEAALAQAYRAIRAEATRIAGAPGDILPRARALLEIYRDSGRNHAFPLIAAHGALWGKRYFDAAGPIGEAISYRYFYDRAEMRRRKAMLDRFSEDFKSANREVFVDTYANYYFTRAHGEDPGAGRFVRGELLRALRGVHRARAARALLDAEDKRKVYEIALRFEQEGTVGPRVAEAIAKFDCPILRTLSLKPVVRFDYFPARTRFWFRDFSDRDERIEYALRAYDLATRAGWIPTEDLLDEAIARD